VNPVPPFRVIVDTNTLLRGIADPTSASGRVLTLCDQRNILILLSRALLAEYRRVLGAPEIVRRNPAISGDAVELVLRRLRYVGEHTARPGARFRFDRDRRDEPVLELAIAAAATHIITNDKDLLSLPLGHDEASKRLRQRLPGLRILRPARFLFEYDGRQNLK
jgi:uncharacterized protein